MKAMFLAVAALFLFAACTGDSYGSGGGGAQPTTPFEKATTGEWLTACQRDQTGFFTEKIVMKPKGSGVITINYFQTQDCSGNASKTEGPTNFMYQADEKAMAEGRPVDVSITMQGRQPAKVTIQVEDNTMTVTSAGGGTMKYTRVSPPPQSDNGPIATGPLTDFDKAAVGVWVSETCYQGSQMLLVQILGNGKGVTLRNVFRSADCTGEAKAEGQENFTYKVDRFANGGGQLTIDGKKVMAISIQGERMTASTEQGSVNYKKLK